VAAIVKGLESDDPAIREGTLFAIRETYDEQLAKALAALPRRRRRSPRSPRCTASPRPGRANWWGTQPVAQPPPAKSWSTRDEARPRDAPRRARRRERRRAPRGRRQRRRHEGRPGRAGPPRLFAKETDVDVRKSILRSLGAIKDAARRGARRVRVQGPALLIERGRAAEQIGGPTLIQMLADLAETRRRPKSCARRSERWAAEGRRARRPRSTPAHADPKVALARVDGARPDRRRRRRQALIAASRSRASRSGSGDRGAGDVAGEARPSRRSEAYFDKPTRSEAIWSLAADPRSPRARRLPRGARREERRRARACRKAVAALARRRSADRAKMEARCFERRVVELQRVYNKPVASPSG
jgi:hypothetical protein